MSDKTALSFILFWVNLAGLISYGSVLTMFPYEVGYTNVLTRGNPCYLGNLSFPDHWNCIYNTCEFHKVYTTRFEPTHVWKNLKQRFSSFGGWESRCIVHPDIKYITILDVHSCLVVTLICCLLSVQPLVSSWLAVLENNGCTIAC